MTRTAINTVINLSDVLHIAMRAFVAILIGASVMVGAIVQAPETSTQRTIAPMGHNMPALAGVGTLDTNERLSVDYDIAPPLLWNSLAEAGVDYYDHGTDGYGVQSVPLGTVVPFAGGLFWATGNGWMGCVDWATFDGECSATGPVEPITPCPWEYEPAAYEATSDELVVLEDETPNEIWNALRDAGWTGVAGDGQSALYIPHGIVVDTADGPMVANASGWVRAQI